MNLGEIRTRCKIRYRDTPGVWVKDSVWNGHINGAFYEFIQFARWPFLITSTQKVLAVGSKRIPLTKTEIENIMDIYDLTQDRMLMPLPDSMTIKNKTFLETQDSQPLFYSMVGLYVNIFPAIESTGSAHTIEIFYLASDPTGMINDADIPQIPVRYHEYLVSGALSKAYADDRNGDAQARARAEFTAGLEQAAREQQVEGQREKMRQDRAQNRIVTPTLVSGDEV